MADAGKPGGATPDSVGSLSELYLGNILYALERCALSLESDEKPLDAAFYRAIGRKLAEAHRFARTTSDAGATSRLGQAAD